MRGGWVLLLLGLCIRCAWGTVAPADAFFSDREVVQVELSPGGGRWVWLLRDSGRTVAKYGSWEREETELRVDSGEALSFHWRGESSGWLQVLAEGRREIWTVHFSNRGGMSLRKFARLESSERLIGVDESGFFTRRRMETGDEEVLVYSSKTVQRIARIPARAEDAVSSRGNVLIHTIDAEGKASLWIANRKGKRLLRTFEPEESLRIVRINPEECSAWILSNQGSLGGFTGLQRIALDDGRTLDRIEDPKAKGDVIVCSFEPDAIAPGYVAFAHPDSQDLWSNREWPEVLQTLTEFKQWRPVSFARAGVLVTAFEAVDSTERPYFVIVDRKRKAILLKEPRFSALKSVELGASFAVVIPTDDGFEVPTIVTLPPHWKPGNPVPTILFPHGGPFLQTVRGFDARVQFLASRGYVVLQPNYRGSTGFGRRHQNAARRNWGPDGIQQDLDRVVEWAVKTGYTDLNAIGIFGGSFGGYLALSTACFRPEAYRCAASFFAPSCMAELLLENPPGIAPSAGLLKHYFSDPHREKDREAMQQWSPRYHSPRIPLLIYQGGRDPLIHPSHAVEFLKKSAGKWAADTLFLFNPNGGHGFDTTEDEIAAYIALEQFFAAHLGGKRSAPSTATLHLIEQWRAEGQHATNPSAQ